MHPSGCMAAQWQGMLSVYHRIPQQNGVTRGVHSLPVLRCSEDVLLALMGPLGMGDFAPAAQGALVGGLSQALAGVVASLPEMGGSTQPTAAQVLENAVGCNSKPQGVFLSVASLTASHNAARIAAAEE